MTRPKSAKSKGLKNKSPPKSAKSEGLKNESPMSSISSASSRSSRSSISSALSRLSILTGTTRSLEIDPISGEIYELAEEGPVITDFPVRPSTSSMLSISTRSSETDPNWGERYVLTIDGPTLTEKPRLSRYIIKNLRKLAEMEDFRPRDELRKYFGTMPPNYRQRSVRPNQHSPLNDFVESNSIKSIKKGKVLKPRFNDAIRKTQKNQKKLKGRQFNDLTNAYLKERSRQQKTI